MIVRAFDITFKDEAIQTVNLKAGTWTFHAFVNALTYSIGLKDSTGVWHNYDLSDQTGAGWYDVQETIMTDFDAVEISLLNNAGTAQVLFPMFEKGSRKSVKRPHEKDIEEAAIIKSASWEIHTSSPVIYKDAPDLTTDGVHTPVTVTGRHWVGSVMTEEGFLTVTANDEIEAANASPSPVTIVPLNSADKHTYTIRLYSDANKTELLDYETIPVVFKGAKGVSAIRLHINNPVDVLPADSTGNVLSFTGTGTGIHVFEGAVELDYDGIGTANGKFKVTAVPSNITMGAITDGGNICIVEDATEMTADKASIVYTVTGKTLDGFDFTVSGEQNFTKTNRGADGDGITGTTIEYAKDASGTTPPTTGWSVNLPTTTLGWYLWTRTTTTYRVAAPTVAYSVSRYAEDGLPGDPGTGVDGLRTEYYLSTSSTTQTGGTWQTTVPVWVAGTYIWERIVTVMSDLTEVTGTPYLSRTWETINQLQADIVEEQAKTQFQTTTDGGLIYTALMKLFDAGTGDETAGISGILGSDGSKPSFYSGGTYSQALGLVEFLYNMSISTPAGTGAGQFDYAGKYAQLAKITILHNGAGKYGDFLVLKNGVVVIVDPETGQQRLTFSVQDLPSLSTLLSTINPGGSVTNTSVTVPYEYTLPNTINVTENGSDIEFKTVGLLQIDKYRLSAEFGYYADPYARVRGFVYLYKDGVRYSTLGATFINKDNPSSSIDIKQKITNCPIGTYSVSLEFVFEPSSEVTNIVQSIGETSLSWAFTQSGVRRFQFGRDGFMAIYSLLHLYLSETEGLNIKGKTDMPGVLLSATVSSGGGWAAVWGAKGSTTTPANNSTGKYTVYHTVGHTNYQVSAVSLTASKTCNIVSKGSDNFVIEWRTVASTPALANTGFEFQIIGNNYA
jgi:hypothetical protein